jgi:vanillate O-demethylase ferredoxin subunit
MTGSTLIVSEVRTETPLIRRIRLAHPQGQALAPLASGAHLQVMVPGLPERRCYSIVQLVRRGAGCRPAQPLDRRAPRGAKPRRLNLDAPVEGG